MGEVDPHAMADRMSSKLLTEWQGYYRLQHARAEAARKKKGL